MRTLSTALRQVYEAEGGYAVHSRARLSNDEGSTWTDVRTLKDRDFYLGAAWTESVDQGITELHLYLRREVDGWSLSPFMESNPVNLTAGSYTPLLRKGYTRVQVQVAIRPVGAVHPEEADWLTVFYGVLEAYGGGSGEGVLDCYCRDLGALLMHSFIEEEREYGSDTGVSLELVIAQLLSDNYLAPGYVRWEASTSFPLATEAIPTPGNATGYWYLGDFDGGETTGATEPTWPTSGTLPLGVADGTTTWFLTSFTDNVYLLYTPTSPGWDLGRYKQKCEPLYTACETLAMQLGWRTSYVWDSSDNYRFTLWAPDRDATVPVYTLKECQRRAVPSFGAETDYIRNAVEIVYFDKATLDASGQPTLSRVLVDKDYAGDAGVAALAAASEAAHGRRFMRYAPAAGANIDTLAEAERLGEAAIKDLADPMVDFEVETPFLHFLQLGDLITVPADGENHDTDLDAAVTTLRHALTMDGRASTTLGLRGRPQGARVQWMQRMAHPALSRPLNLTGPDAPTNVTVEPTTEGLLVWFDEPLRGIRPFEYELHLSTSSDFTPSSSTLFATTRTNNFTVTGYEPGTTYYAKVVPRSAPLEANRAGVRGTASSQVTVVPRYVEPRRLQPFVERGSLIPNDSFEAQNDPSAPPDTWTMVTGTWGTTADITSDARSGDNAILFSASQNNSLESQFITAQPDMLYQITAWAKRSTLPGTETAALNLTFYDASFAVTGTAVSATMALSATGTWEQFYAVGVAPAGARYLRAKISQSSASNQDITVDSVRVKEARVLMEELRFDDATTVFSNNFDNVSAPTGTYNRFSYYKGADDVVNLQGRIYRTAGGAPAAGTTMVGPLPAEYRPRRECTFIVPTDTGAGVVSVTTAGNVVYESGGVTWISLDGLCWRPDV